MESIKDEILPFYESQEFPPWLIPKIRDLGLSGLNVKGYGSPELSFLESGVICYEFARRDASIMTFFLIHCAAGMAVIEAFGDEE